MGIFTKKKKTDDKTLADADSPWGQAISVPRADSETTEQKHKRTKYTKFILGALSVIGAVAIVSNAVYMSNFDKQEMPDITMNEQQINAKASAQTIVQDWLKESKPIGNGAVLASWDRQDVTGDKNSGSYYTTEYFTVYSPAQEKSYSANVVMNVSKKDGITQSTDPSLFPRQQAPEAKESLAFDKTMSKAKTTDAMKQASEVWAKTFTGNESSKLRLLVQDPDPTHYYPIMPGLKVESVTLSNAVSATGKAEDNPGMVYARAVVNLGDGSTKAPIEYDLLIKNANTAAPFVVAWATPSTQPTFKEWSNAVVRDSNEATPDTTESAAPTAAAASESADAASSSAAESTSKATP